MTSPRVHERRPLIEDLDVRDPLPLASAGTTTHTPARNHALDNLRTFLVALVVLHHTAIVYGGAGGWKLRSRCFPPESIALITFNAVDQTFFMALFFFLSGHFTQIQMSKNGATKSAVIRSRLLRILLPAVIYTIFIEPTLDVMVWLWDREVTNGAAASVWSVYLTYWSRLGGIRGPVWYLALVTMFDAIAVLGLWNVGSPRVDDVRNTVIRSKYFWAPVAWAVTILADFAVRIVYPVGKVWPVLNLQLAFLPQYVLAYLGGHLSTISDDLFILMPFQYDIQNPKRKMFRSLMFCLSCLGLLTLLDQKIMGIDMDQVMELMRGGFNFAAATYAVWNEMGFALIGFAIVAVFVRHGDFPWRWRNVWLPRYSYAAFLLHPLVSLGIELAVESLMGCRTEDHRSYHGLWSLLGSVLLTLVVGVVNVFASWTAAWCFVSFVPFMSRIV